MTKSDDEGHNKGKPNYAALTENGKPGWTEILESYIKDNPKETTYAFSTLNNGSPANRFVIHRSLTSASSFLLTTTDIRMPKASQLSQNSAVEIAWWMQAPNIQFRITGNAFLIPNDADTSAEGKEKLEKVLKEMEAQGVEGDAEWWIKERMTNWGKISGHLRGTFGRPAPSSRLDEHTQKPQDWPVSIPAEAEEGNAEQKKQVEFAKSHFTLLAIAPSSFEVLELSAKPNKKNKWTKKSDGSWGVEGLVP